MDVPKRVAEPDFDDGSVHHSDTQLLLVAMAVLGLLERASWWLAPAVPGTDSVHTAMAVTAA